MAIAVHPPSAADLWDQYARLPASPKLALRLKSLLWLATGKGVFLECLTGSGSRAPDGKAWTSRSVNDVLERLLRQGLLTEDLACAPALLHRVSIDACGSEEGEALVAAVRRSFPALRSMGYYASVPQVDSEAVQRLIWLAIHANDATGFVENSVLSAKSCAASGAAHGLAALFIATPLAPDWLSSRAPVIQAALIATKLSAFLQGGVPAPDLPALIEYARSWPGREGFAGLGSALAQYDLLAGRLDLVRRGLAEIEDPHGAKQPAMEGVLAFLEGRNAEALERFRAALKLHRKAAGKRKTFLDGLAGVFFLMALLQANDAALQAEIEAGIDTALSSPGPYAGAILALQALLWLSQGLEPKAREVLGQLRARMPAEPLSAACTGLAEFAVDTNLARAQSTELAARFERWQEHLPLIARMYAEMLAEVAEAPGPYQNYLARTGPGIAVSFTQLVQTRQPWERALESLDAFLGAGSPKPAAGPAPRKAKRLVWFLDPETQEIEVAEQSAKGSEGWSDGRAVALKRLHDRDPRLDYLTEQDRAALRFLRKESSGWYDRDSYAFDPQRTIPALIGHPAVFDRRHRLQPLELVAYPLELVVAERRGGFYIGLSHTASEPCIFLEAETPTRYRVVEFPQRMLAVQEILGRRGLTVPAGARDRVVALVQRQHSKLPIRAEIDALAGTAMEGQAAPVVQCAPYEEGFKFSLVVRPFGAEGPAYVAGLGSRSLLASVDGQQVRANRDLARELAERLALIEACPTLRDRGGAHAHEVVIEDLEGCLEALLELQAYAGPVSVEWPQGRKLRVSAVAPNQLKLRVRQDRDWFGVDGTVALDADEVLDMRFLLERLGRAQGRFVPLEDGSFVALTRQLQTQLQRLEAVSEPHRSGRRVHALGAPALDAVLEEAGDVRADAAWTRHVSRIRAAEGWTPVLPPSLQAELRDYQIEGFTWLSRLARWGTGACLADDMGLGKTVQAIAVMLERAAEGPCLVVAPTSVCANWESEIARFAPTLTAHRLSAAGDRAARVAGLGAYDVLVCSYGLLHQAAETLAARHWQMVALDEAQAIKNAETKRAQASVALQADFRLALTGTPIENYLDELWSLFNFVNPGLLGSRDGFQKRFAVPIERDHNAHARQALRALIRPFLLRRTKAAVLSELPPRTEQTVIVKMDRAERAFYEALRQRAVEKIAALDAPRGKRKIQILAEITRLRRACCNPALIDADAAVPSAKLEVFLDLAQGLTRNRHRALVFSQFVGHLALVRTALEAQGIDYEYLDGATPANERERRVAAFQSGRAALFLISLRAGGTGLNLTAADYVVHLDPWWNPAVEDQASDRAHRIGQERPVTIYRLIMQDSIEQRIVQLHRDKRDLASDLLEGAETAARLSEEALLDLMRA